MPQTNVAIVGAGITGLSIAWHLAQRDAGSITMYDGSGIGAGATAIQPGGVRQQWSSALTCLMAREAFRFYENVDALLEPKVTPGLDRCGYLFVAEREAELEVLRERVALQQGLGVPSEMLTPAQVTEVVPGLDAGLVIGAAYCRDDSYFARPQAVVAAFADAGRRLGVDLVSENVARIAPDADGWRLRLADGTTHLAGQVVVSAAHQTALLLTPLGIDLPITRERRYLFYSDPIRERLLEPLVMSGERHFAAKQLADGSVLASDLSADGDPEEDRSRWYSRVRWTISELLPILEYVSFPVLVEGDYDVTPDAQPILGPVDGYTGLWVAAGLNGRGFMMAPVVGRFISERVCGGAKDDRLCALDPGRFAAAPLIREGQVV
jgi:sarcosine oxidase subunit beta